ncbi:hypothetical protein Dda_5190 [Drechslerella dactyloides]|uniref:Uncharacterized protein n=1 Tax=Drechslerella dactyloides TaxID=74499 RepID=A0AAD6NJZ3_DREDA|nr:hypothetical protein Dda_5190 [Drechslerella dactyloides]
MPITIPTPLLPRPAPSEPTGEAGYDDHPVPTLKESLKSRERDLHSGSIREDCLEFLREQASLDPERSNA